MKQRLHWIFRVGVGMMLGGGAWQPARAQMAPSFGWADLITGPHWQAAKQIAADGNGNVYTAGTFQGSTTLGPLSRTGTMTGGNSDIFVARYNPAGVPQWIRQIQLGPQLAGQLSLWDMQADAAGNVWVLGEFGDASLQVEGSSTLYPSTPPYNVMGPSDVFLTKYDAQGTWQWTKLFASVYDDFPAQLALDGQGNAFVGYTETRLRPPGAGQSPVEWTKVMLRKVDGAGNVVASQDDGVTASSGGSLITTLTYNADDNTLYTSGYMRVPQQMAGTALAAPNGQDLFLARYSGALQPLGAQTLPAAALPTTPTDRVMAVPRSMTPVAGGGVILALDFSGSVQLGTATHQNPSEYRDILLANYSTLGAYRWSRQLNTTGYPTSIRQTAGGQYLLTGVGGRAFPWGNYQFALNPVPLAGFEAANGFVAALDGAGQPLWLRQSVASASPGFDQYAGAAASSGGQVWVCGSLYGSADFNGTTLTTTGANAMYPDGFVARLDNIATRLGFTPAAGAVGTQVVINGSSLQGATAVRFNGVAATTFRVNAPGDQIVATVPAGASTGPLSIVTPTGTVTTTSAFTVSGTLSRRVPTTLLFSLYPNPARGTVRVQVPGGSGARAVVSDALGRRVAATQLPAGGGQLDVQGLPPGVYLVQVSTATATATQRLVLE
ncbi:T9SS type A sorting domain-containing protein [Hymenobacter gummosus]|uniref:T9SS type A sorting domain-containing protein n=1 Tax=Hymenobacter gummosus TaxID=1776032 RepID=A0A431TUX4_9BACT|nr:T9SS type A sorting domain-containing protein [Hymenobacter gummosus]RTQ44960.1 T9SS type A sorting domain-containing protein [Hymenobacter gummosus]